MAGKFTKILVLSDSHRNRSALEGILRSNTDADEIIFLGDGEDDIEQCRYILPDVKQGCVRIVCGNCDMFSFDPAEMIFERSGHRFLCTHGHQQNVKRGLIRLAEEAMEKGCDIVLYGHTHEADYCEDYKGLKLFNPGAVFDHCYGVITIDADTGEAAFEHKKYL